MITTPRYLVEIQSALLSLVVSFSLLFHTTQTTLYNILYKSHALPQWAQMGVAGGVFCLVAAFVSNTKIQMGARFISGCIWGTLILILIQADILGPMFWEACVLFGFDVFLVLEKGHVWMRKSRS
jgi:hypothetical protein